MGAARVRCSRSWPGRSSRTRARSPWVKGAQVGLRGPGDGRGRPGAAVALLGSVGASLLERLLETMGKGRCRGRPCAHGGPGPPPGGVRGAARVQPGPQGEDHPDGTGVCRGRPAQEPGRALGRMARASQAGAACCCRARTSCFWTNPPTTSTWKPWSGWRSICSTSGARWPL